VDGDHRPQLASSLVFFLATNAALIGGSRTTIHSTALGLGECLPQRCPFIDGCTVGDVAWTAAIFGTMQAVGSWAPRWPRSTRRETT